MSSREGSSREISCLEYNLVSSSSSAVDAGQKSKPGEDQDAESSVVVAAGLMGGCAALMVMQCRKKKGKALGHDSPLFTTPISFNMISDFYGQEMFRKTFRMSRITFDLLLSKVYDLLDRRFVSSSEYRRQTVPADIRLAITLRVLAGGSYCDICLAYHVKESTVFEIFTSTCDALMERLLLEGLPKTDLGLHRIAKGFRTSRPEASPIYGCVGALDGICIKIKKPAPCESPATFYSRKGFYALPVQALCDSNYIFRYCSALCTGATHDGLAYAVSGLKRDIDSGILGVMFFIVGDEAYICTEELLTPFRSENADFDQNNFNFSLSSLRIHMEQAFGMLVARWRILRGGLEYSVSRSADIVCLLMKLHNFCITYDCLDSTTTGLSEEENEHLESDVREWYNQSHEIAEEFRTRARSGSATRSRPRSSRCSRKRNVLVAIVKEKNRSRPPPAPLTWTGRA